MTTTTPTTAAVSTPGATGELWRNREFLTFWFGETLSLLGTQVTTLALPLTAVIAFHASPAQVGLLRFLQLVPYLGLALVFGALVDRMRRRRVMIAANAARMVLIGLIPLLAATHLLTIGLLLGLACAIGIFSVLFDVSWMSFVPTLVKDKAHYVEANQKLGVTSSTTDVAGPGIAGALIGALTAPISLVVDSTSYLVSLATLLLIRTPETPPAPAAEKRHLGGEIAEGLRFVLGHRVLRPLALVGPFCNFSMISVWTLFLLYAVRDEGLPAGLVGLVFSASSIGGLVGAALSGALLKRFRTGAVYAVSMTLVFAGPLLIPFAAGSRPVLLAFFVAAFFLSYLGLGVANVVMVSLRQASTPQALMGRMNAAFRTLLFGGGSLGGLIGGYLAGGLGTHTALTGIAIGSALMVLAVAASPVSRLKAMPAAQ
ncbi:MFS family permease [Kitasatospora sp. GP30]|uniref:MFS transporter n=1 Tax=Kitasatospora sp. GP30 TaxID=3035084 RepID=UPI000C705E97|nr:MFS transporter [Kitasatospora sp. GP30]MDH6144909.1 MFS family permease [Kitasatospora sp. GP30]